MTEPTLEELAKHARTPTKDDIGRKVYVGTKDDYGFADIIGRCEKSELFDVKDGTFYCWDRKGDGCIWPWKEAAIVEIPDPPKPAFTPGPWEFDISKVEGIAQVFIKTRDRSHYICQMVSPNYDNDLDFMVRNAKLIKNSPDMLYMLKQIASDGPQYRTDTGEVLDIGTLLNQIEK